MGASPSRLYVSTLSKNARRVAAERSLGLEIGISDPAKLEDFAPHREEVLALMRGAERFTAHGPYCDLIPSSIDPRIRQVARDRFEQAYAAMCSLGIRRVVLHDGYIPHSVNEEDWIRDSAVFWRAFLADKPQDFHIMIENVHGNSPELLADMLDEIGDPRARACLDIGHVNLSSSRGAAEWARALGRRVAHVHMHNNQGDRDEHLELHRGTIDMKATLEALLEHAPDATFCIETLADAAIALEWLDDQGFRL